MDSMNQSALDAARQTWLIAFAVAIPCFILLFWKLNPGLGRSLAVTGVFLLFLSPCYNYYYLDAWMAGIWPSMVYILNAPRDPLSALFGLFAANPFPRLLMAALILAMLEVARLPKRKRKREDADQFPPFA